MNNRIKQIAEQAGYYTAFDPDGTLVRTNTPGADGDLALFADLLIQACITLVEPSNEHREDAAWGYIGGQAGVQLLDGRVDDIKEHFGVTR